MASGARAELQPVYVPLRLTYGLLPIAAGLDKFFNVLANWEAYLPTSVAQSLPIAPATFMQVVGLIEVVAGLAVLLGLVRLGGLVVAAWLAAIAVVAAAAGYFDIAARDVAMSVGAYALARLAGLRGEEWIPVTTRLEGQKAHAGAN
jgi:uncharacterized membrane protein YphA (DoxX/SURF4 family)